MLQALAGAGWGLLAVALYHLLPMTFDTLAWRALLPATQRPSLAFLLGARWVREAVDNLLPVAQIGGELVGLRLLLRRGVAGAAAGASLVLDVTLAVLTQLLFTLLGLGLLLLVVRDAALTATVLSGVALGAAGLAGFILVQRRGVFSLLTRWLAGIGAGQRWLALAGGAGRLDAAIGKLYRDRCA
ncbi:MAG: lysylphosphatidylglycerol synthase domain-containing protein, partial [Pseudomonadota bacterium]|nr:lysylphosphatidylglycerol synthase domain-containing protein [Pseudomonadota bacterium]